MIGYGDKFDSPSHIEGARLKIVQKVALPLFRAREPFYKKSNLFASLLSSKLPFSALFAYIFKIISRLLRYFLRQLPFSALFAHIFKIISRLLRYFLRQIISLHPRKFFTSLAILPAYKHVSSLLFAELCEENYAVVHAHDIIALMAAVMYKQKYPHTVINGMLMSFILKLTIKISVPQNILKVSLLNVVRVLITLSQ